MTIKFHFIPAVIYDKINPQLYREVLPNMEDKMFELMTKMYSEFSEFRKETNDKFDSLNSEVKGLRGDVVRIENDLSKKVDAALDGYQQVYEKQFEHDKRFDSLEGEMKKQDVEIHVIKGGLTP